MQTKNEKLLSVLIISYKQVNYIREAIDSVLNQKVDFKYELLLADDYSCDGTLEIMKEYEKKYPDIVKVLERKKNLGASNNTIDAFQHTKGKYITVLEGDDYWCNDNRIQIQVDFLEANPEYATITHLQEGRNLNNEVQGLFPKGFHKPVTVENIQDFIDNNKVFSMSACLYRNFTKDKKQFDEFCTLRNYDPVIGDAQMNIFLCSLGKVYILPEAMMVYRMRNNDGDSNFNSSHRVNEIQYRYLNIYMKLEDYYDNKYSFYKKIRECYSLGVAYDICKFNFKDIAKFNSLCDSKYKWKIILLFPFTCVSILYKRFIKK